MNASQLVFIDETWVTTNMTRRYGRSLRAEALFLPRGAQLDTIVTGDPAAGLRRDAAPLQIDHAHDHRATRVERQILKPPLGVEGAHAVVEWMRDDANAADDLSRPQRHLEGKQQERRRVRLPLVVLVDRKLAEKCHRHWIWPIALLRLGQEGALDLSCAQGDVADDGT